MAFSYKFVFSAFFTSVSVENYRLPRIHLYIVTNTLGITIPSLSFSLFDVSHLFSMFPSKCCLYFPLVTYFYLFVVVVFFFSFFFVSLQHIILYAFEFRRVTFLIPIENNFYCATTCCLCNIVHCELKSNLYGEPFPVSMNCNRCVLF